MSDLMHRQATQRMVKRRFKGRKKLTCKVKPIYPASSEREYQRVTDAYMKILSGIVKEYLPEIRAAAASELESGFRTDGLPDLLNIISGIFSKMINQLLEKLDTFPMREKLGRVAYQLQKLSVREWKRQVHDTLGLNLLEDYYKKEFYREMLEKWVAENVSLIKTIPQECLERMREIVLDGYRSGISTPAIVKKIQKEYSISKSHARLIARDQIGKLNCDITRKQQQDAGVEEYEWSDSDDERVRKRHKKLSGKRYRWDDPPVVDEKRGRRCHPGQDYQCRCVALPVFGFDTLNLPISE